MAGSLTAAFPDVAAWFDAHTFLRPYGWHYLTAAGVFLLIVAACLPRSERARLKTPVVLLVLAAFWALLSELVAAAELVRHSCQSIALFCLLASVGRAVFLLVFRARPLLRWMPALPRIFLDIIQGVIYMTALLITLNVAGVATSSLITGSALVTAAIGFSMKDTLGNIFAGLAIHAENPFEIGDWIQFDDKSQNIGKVLEINWRATKVITLDLVEVVVPNAQLAQAPIRNYTKPLLHSRRSVYVLAPYTVPPQQIQRIILDALPGAWGVLSDPAPSVVTNAFMDQGVQYWVRFFTSEFGSRDKVDSGVRDRIWYAFHRNGVTIPFPIRDVRAVRIDPHMPTRERERQVAEYRQALGGIDFLEDLPEPALQQLAESARRRLYAPGEVVLRQGETGSELFIIRSGEVAVTIQHDFDPPQEITRLGPEQFFGELSLMTGATRSATVTAMVESELFVIDKPAFAPILAAAPELAEHIGATLARRSEQRGALAARRTAAPASQPEIERDLLGRIKAFFGI